MYGWIGFPPVCPRACLIVSAFICRLESVEGGGGVPKKRTCLEQAGETSDNGASFRLPTLSSDRLRPCQAGLVKGPYFSSCSFWPMKVDESELFGTVLKAAVPESTFGRGVFRMSLPCPHLRLLSRPDTILSEVASTLNFRAGVTNVGQFVTLFPANTASSGQVFPLSSTQPRRTPARSSLRMPAQWPEPQPGHGSITGKVFLHLG